MGMFAEQGFRALPVAVADGVDNRMMHAVRSEQQVIRAIKPDLVKHHHRRRDEGHNVQPLDKGPQRRRLARIDHQLMEPRIHDAVSDFIFGIEVTLVEQSVTGHQTVVQIGQ